MKKINLLNVVILLIGFTSCHKEDVPNYDLNTYSIFWEESSAWADFYYKANIDQNGKLDVQEKYRLSNQYRESQFQVSTEDMSLIKEKLENLLSIDISDEYGFLDNAATDAPTTKMKYMTMNKSDSTYLYYPNENELPDKLDIFMQVVYETISKTDTLKN
ncbi:MAG: hypothetical protein CVU09_17030 [Bacteroidetes bacterium HGW-Bacteroidetes-4]|jgi:hypothetical protein|nr:MAG: hypothetical protein CVU09_17030 [Bacteroidetes bacterium HGW-Bacteroidetes-4]